MPTDSRVPSSEHCILCNHDPAIVFVGELTCLLWGVSMRVTPVRAPFG
jgi:hypothetical protein